MHPRRHCPAIGSRSHRNLLKRSSFTTGQSLNFSSRSHSAHACGTHAAAAATAASHAFAAAHVAATATAASACVAAAVLRVRTQAPNGRDTAAARAECAGANRCCQRDAGRLRPRALAPRCAWLPPAFARARPRRLCNGRAHALDTTRRVCQTAVAY
eukprot:4773266-Pleurochrysis_carterae.AAC.2